MIALTNNELEVLSLAAQGKRRVTIAKTMNYSLGGVMHHRKMIYRKLGARNITEAVAIAIRKGLI